MYFRYKNSIALSRSEISSKRHSKEITLTKPSRAAEYALVHYRSSRHALVLRGKAIPTLVNTQIMRYSLSTSSKRGKYLRSPSIQPLHQIQGSLSLNLLYETCKYRLQSQPLVIHTVNDDLAIQVDLVMYQTQAVQVYGLDQSCTGYMFAFP